MWHGPVASWLDMDTDPLALAAAVRHGVHWWLLHCHEIGSPSPIHGDGFGDRRPYCTRRGEPEQQERVQCPTRCGRKAATTALCVCFDCDKIRSEVMCILYRYLVYFSSCLNNIFSSSHWRLIGLLPCEYGWGYSFFPTGYLTGERKLWRVKNNFKKLLKIIQTFNSKLKLI